MVVALLLPRFFLIKSLDSPIIYLILQCTMLLMVAVIVYFKTDKLEALSLFS